MEHCHNGVGQGVPARSLQRELSQWPHSEPVVIETQRSRFLAVVFRHRPDLQGREWLQSASERCMRLLSFCPRLVQPRGVELSCDTPTPLVRGTDFRLLRECSPYRSIYRVCRLLGTAPKCPLWCVVSLGFLCAVVNWGRVCTRFDLIPLSVGGCICKCPFQGARVSFERCSPTSLDGSTRFDRHPACVPHMQKLSNQLGLIFRGARGVGNMQYRATQWRSRRLVCESS